MGIILRWREEPLDCEYRDSRRGGTLSLYMDGELVWKEEAVSSAAAAHCRAREARDELFPRRARRA